MICFARATLPRWNGDSTVDHFGGVGDTGVTTHRRTASGRCHGLPQNAALACQKDMEHDRTGVVSAVDREAGLRSRLADAYVRSAPGGIRLAYLLTGDRAAAKTSSKRRSSGSWVGSGSSATLTPSSRTCDARS